METKSDKDGTRSDGVESGPVDVVEVGPGDKEERGGVR